jgi:hypothetical protein
MCNYENKNIEFIKQYRKFIVIIINKLNRFTLNEIDSSFLNLIQTICIIILNNNPFSKLLPKIDGTIKLLFKYDRFTRIDYKVIFL